MTYSQFELPVNRASATDISPLDPQSSLLSHAEDVAVADHPEEGEEDDAAGEDRGVELDTPDAGGDRGAAQQDGHPVPSQRPPPRADSGESKQLNRF